MQYLVNVSGEVYNKENKTYIIRSSSFENAQTIAAKKFCNEFAVDSCEVAENPRKRTGKAIVSLAFMLVPILLSLIDWKVGHKTVSINPDYISCLYATLIYATFVVRVKGIKHSVESSIDIFFCIFVVLLLSTFIRTIMVTKTISLLGFENITIDTNILLPVIALLSCFGQKLVSVICMIVVMLFAMFNIINLNEAMGMFFGPLYIICSFVGILLYLSVEPAVEDILYAVRKATVKGVKYISNDVVQAGRKMGEINSSVNKKINAMKKEKSSEKE